MQIEILDNEHYSGNAKPGRYELQPCGNWTDQQRKTFFALARCFLVSGCHSYNTSDFKIFYDLLKRDFGAGAVKYWRVTDGYGNPLKEPVLDSKLKSLSEYTKRECADLIANVISIMHQAGVQTLQFYEILKTLEDNNWHKNQGEK